MLDDFRMALRSLRARPGPTGVAVTCLALGIGANMALFGTVDALLFRPPAGIEDPASVVRVRVGGARGPVSSGAGPVTSYAQYRTVLEQRRDVLSGLAAYGTLGATLGGGTDGRAGEVRVVTANFFEVLGVRPRLGRFFDDGEGAPGSGAPVAVLSHREWEVRWARDPGVLGRTVTVNRVPLTVIGVAPRGFVGADLDDPDLWIPAGLTALPEFGGAGRLGPGAGWLQLVGRLAPGVTLAQARARTAAEPSGDPFTAVPVQERTAGGTEPVVPLTLLPARTMFFAGTMGEDPVPPWALGVTGAVLLLACATVANLLLAQAVLRRRDAAIRLAVGGSPARILKERLLESLVLASMSLVAATGVAALSVYAVRRLPVPPLPGLLNGRSVAVGAAVTLLTPLVFGVVPALWAARREVGDVLRDRGGGIASVSRLQNGLMAAQTAIGFMLLVVAALFVRSLGNIRAVDTGMDVDRVRTVTLTGRPASASAPMLGEEAVERVRELPGVEAAALGTMIPFYLYARGSVRVAERAPDSPPRSVLYNTVGPDFFRTLGIDVVAGRALDERDVRGAAPVAMVSEALARAEWPGGEALGACLDLGGGGEGTCATVVGIAGGVRYGGPFDDPSMTVYLPAAQASTGPAGGTIFVRAGEGGPSLVREIRAALRSLDPTLPYVEVARLDARLDRQLVAWRVGARLFSVFGLLATLLAAVGLYMVVSFIATQRTRELGIRSALGAGRLRLVGLVLLAALRIAGAGLVVGVGLGAATAALFRSRLYGLGFVDASTYASVAGLLLAITLVASLRPAARASGADPAVVLREGQT